MARIISRINRTMDPVQYSFLCCTLDIAMVNHHDSLIPLHIRPSSMIQYDVKAYISLGRGSEGDNGRSVNLFPFMNLYSDFTRDLALFSFKFYGIHVGL